jgi:hypothetical protein
MSLASLILALAPAIAAKVKSKPDLALIEWREALIEWREAAKHWKAAFDQAAAELAEARAELAVSRAAYDRLQREAQYRMHAAPLNAAYAALGQNAMLAQQGQAMAQQGQSQQAAFYGQGLAQMNQGLLGAQNLDAGHWHDCNCVPARHDMFLRGP